MGMRVWFEGFVVDYEEPPVDMGAGEYSIVLDGTLKDEDGSPVHEGYFYLVAPKDIEGRLDLGIGSGISGIGELVLEGDEPVVRYLSASER